ncbi:diaminopimelate decarboxylase [Candidatus Woesearchaeota archaeon]|nr:diaminopimelate decarboxylase [Candidatus Woesearchaeota archaeon]
MDMNKLPFTKTQIEQIIKTHPTPFIIYDEKAIRENAKHVNKAFSWVPGFKNYFAVKANPNPFLLKILKEEGMGTDCSSLPELILSEKIGTVGEDIMFTSNDTPTEEFVKAKELGAVINLDDISHIDFLEKSAGIPDLICFRYNPGSARAREHAGFIGNPEDAKYGLTHEQLFEAYKIAKEKGVKRFGLHTMVISNELNPAYFVDTAKMLFELVVDIKKEVDVDIEFVNLGGGIGIPHKPEDKPVDLEYLSSQMKEVYDEIVVKNGLDGLKIVMECGRMITGPYGYLVSTVRHIKNTYKDYVGLDACMANNMRPALYGAYHHIVVLGKENDELTHKYDVTGSLCENNDKFAIDRILPEIVRSDIFVIRQSGAHGYAMGFNYNGKLKSAELLLREDGSVVQIRRAETVDDYFATLDFDKLKGFL